MTGYMIDPPVLLMFSNSSEILDILSVIIQKCNKKIKKKPNK